MIEKEKKIFKTFEELENDKVIADINHAMDFNLGISLYELIKITRRYIEKYSAKRDDTYHYFVELHTNTLKDKRGTYIVKLNSYYDINREMVIKTEYSYVKMEEKSKNSTQVGGESWGEE